MDTQHGKYSTNQLGRSNEKRHGEMITIDGEDPVGLDPVFQAVELPARVAHLHTGLTHMDGDDLALNPHIHCHEEK